MSVTYHTRTVGDVEVFYGEAGRDANEIGALMREFLGRTLHE